MTRRTGARVVADTLDGYGVTHVFLVPAILRRTLAELERHHPHIRRVVTHGEKAAAATIDDAGRFPDMLRHAFRVARRGPAGGRLHRRRRALLPPRRDRDPQSAARSTW